MSKVWVCNASPIILLSKVDALDFLIKLADKVYIPEGVKKAEPKI